MSRVYKSLDITGKKYGNLTATKYSHTGKNYMQYWVFKCDCGKEITTRKTAVISGHCKSCGCLQKQIAKQEVVKHSVKHKESNTRLYKIWKGMHSRCNNENSKYYGSRGITVCSEWNDYKNFKEWSNKNGYKDNLTIDRIDYNGNYEPYNCRWATYKEQARNTSRNHYFEFNGIKKMCIRMVRRTWNELKHIFSKIKEWIKPFYRRKSMREHITPEVGDIWIGTETDRIHHITLVENDIIWFAMSYEYSGIQVFWEKLDMFCKECKYLGKSKANINDLFKTENE